MTLVEANGELAGMSPEDARELTDRIKVGVGAVWELVKTAYQGGAHRALGYASWDDYCTREFGTSRIRLPKEERQEVVASLRESGLSTRAIAAATGVNRETVMRDLDEVVGNQPPDSEHTFTPVDIDPETGEVLRDEEPEPERVTGIDGKSYPAKDREAVRARRKRIRELHQSGYSTAQIADAVGMTAKGVHNHLGAMGLTANRSRDKGGRNLAAGDAIEKFVTSIVGTPIAVRSLRPAEAIHDARREMWLKDIDGAMKSLRSLRSALSKGEVHGTEG